MGLGVVEGARELLSVGAWWAELESDRLAQERMRGAVEGEVEEERLQVDGRAVVWDPAEEVLDVLLDDGQLGDLGFAETWADEALTGQLKYTLIIDRKRERNPRSLPIRPIRSENAMSEKRLKRLIPGPQIKVPKLRRKHRLDVLRVRGRNERGAHHNGRDGRSVLPGALVVPLQRDAVARALLHAPEQRQAEDLFWLGDGAREMEAMGLAVAVG